MLPYIRDKAKQSIFWLKVGDEFSGTLVYISAGYFLTNRHVVTTPKKKGRKKDQISQKVMTAGNDISSIIYTLELFAQDASEDLALLKIEGSYSAFPPILQFTKEPDPSGGETVVLMGYQSIITDQLEVSGPVIYLATGNVTAVLPNNFLYSSLAFAGNSGGAVVLKIGGLLGLHRETVSEGVKGTNGQSHAVKKSYLKKFLEVNSVCTYYEE